MKKLLVIIPTYNEAQNVQVITQDVLAISNTISGWIFELLIVDDNSPDGTADIVRKMQVKNHKIHLITGQKSGLGKAYLRGFEWGLGKKIYDAFLMMDADFSHDPAAIPSLLKAFDDGADYVIGSRYVKGGNVSNEWPTVRLRMSRSANWFARLLVGAKGIADLTAGFKAIRGTALGQIDLTGIRASGYVFQVNLLHEFSRQGFKIAEVPITFTQRRSGVSKMRLKDITEFLYLTYRLNPQSRIRRLIRFGLVGASGVIVNLVVITLLITGWHLPVLLSDVVAIEASIISNFVLNYTYTFRAAITSPSKAHNDTPSQLILKMVRFNAIMLGSAAISFVIFAISYRLLGLPYLIADLIGIIIAMGWNYRLSIRVVWGVVDA